MDACNWLFKTHMITNNINKKFPKLYNLKLRRIESCINMLCLRSLRENKIETIINFKKTIVTLEGKKHYVTTMKLST